MVEKSVLRLEAVKKIQFCPDTFLKQEKAVLNCRVKKMAICLIDIKP